MLEHCFQQVVAPSWVSGGVSEALWMRRSQPSLGTQGWKKESGVTMKDFRSDKFVLQEIGRAGLSRLASTWPDQPAEEAMGRS